MAARGTSRGEGKPRSPSLLSKVYTILVEINPNLTLVNIGMIILYQLQLTWYDHTMPVATDMV